MIITPRVLDNVVVLALSIRAITNSSDTVIEVLRAAVRVRVDTALVELE